METKSKSSNFGLCSEEVQEIMGKIPPAILRIGITLIIVFLILFLFVSNFIKYPDVISFPVTAKNVNRITEIKTEKSGQLLKLDIRHHRVNKGDSLAAMAVNVYNNIDTVYIKSPSNGVVYPCDEFLEMDYVGEGDVLCVLVDSVNCLISAKAAVSHDLKNKLKLGMKTESEIDGKVLQGEILSIADYANPINGTYVITIKLGNSMDLNNVIIWNCHADVKIKISEQSVFEKFFKYGIHPTY